MRKLNSAAGRFLFLLGSVIPYGWSSASSCDRTNCPRGLRSPRGGQSQLSAPRGIPPDARTVYDGGAAENNDENERELYFPNPDAPLWFENVGLKHMQPVGDAYNGAGGPNYDFGITFSNSALVYIIGLSEGEIFNGVPSWPTMINNRNGGDIIMDVPASFTTQFSFYYLCVWGGSYEVYSGVNATGTQLTNGSIPALLYFEVSAQRVVVPFNGTARSIKFSAGQRDLFLDNIFLDKINRHPILNCQNATVAPRESSCQYKPTKDELIRAISKELPYDLDKEDTIDVTLDTLGPFPLGTTTVKMTATDSRGGSKSCTVQLTVQNTVPVAKCHDKYFCGDAPDDTNDLFPYIDDGSYDPDGIPLASTEILLGGTYSLEKHYYTVKMTVTDVCGDMSIPCYAVIKYQNRLPIVACGDVSYSVGEKCLVQPDNLPHAIDAGSYDPDGLSNLTVSNSGPFGPGDHEVTLTNTDYCGVSVSCTATVHVTNDPPIAQCRNYTYGTDSQCKASPTNLLHDIQDIFGDMNEEHPIITSNSTGTLDVGTHVVLVNVTDSCGVSSTCQSTVTVVNQAPVARCKNANIRATSKCQASLVDIMGAIDDASSDPEGQAITRSSNLTGPLGIGTHSVNLTVTDACGARSSCVASVTVYDDEAPVVDCGTRGVVAPCETPILLNFVAKTKTNGCPAGVQASLDGCYTCKKVKNVLQKVQVSTCAATTSATSSGSVTISNTGGEASHLVFNVKATNTYGTINGGSPMTSSKTCTICTQLPSSTFNPVCTTQGKTATKNSFTCRAGFPDATLTC